MSRAAAGVDRFLVGLVGLVLIALGVLAILWERELVSWLTPELPAPWLTTATEQGWWPWVLVVAGVVLSLLALWWLLGRLGRSKISTTQLPGSDRSGRLSTDLGSLASAAAESMNDTPGVDSTSGSAKLLKGRRTIILAVTMDASADLPTVVGAAERACAQMGRVLPDSSIATRVDLRTASPNSSAPTTRTVE